MRAACVCRVEGAVAPFVIVECVAKRGLQIRALRNQILRAVEVLDDCPFERVLELWVCAAHFKICLRVVRRAHRVRIRLRVARLHFFPFACVLQERQRIAAQEGVLLPCKTFPVSETGKVCGDERAVQKIGQLRLRGFVVAIPEARGETRFKRRLQRERAERAPTRLRGCVQRGVTEPERTFHIFFAFVGGHDEFFKFRAVRDGMNNFFRRRAPERRRGLTRNKPQRDVERERVIL